MKFHIRTQKLPFKFKTA